MKKKFFLGSVILTVGYLLLIVQCQVLTKYLNVCPYLSDPPTPEMLHWYAFSTTNAGVYCLDWILPLLIVWTSVFFILEMRELLILSCTTGCGLLCYVIRYQQKHPNLNFLNITVNENRLPIFDDSTIRPEWRIWGIAVLLFLLILPFLKKKWFNTTVKRTVFMLTALALSLGNGIIISVIDFGTYSIHILARTFLLVFIACFALRVRKKFREYEMPVKKSSTVFDFFTGIFPFFCFLIPVNSPQSSHISADLSLPLLMLLFCIMLYQLHQTEAFVPIEFLKHRRFIAGTMVLYIALLFLFQQDITRFGNAFIRISNKMIGSRQASIHAGYLFLFLGLAWVFYFLRLQKLQILNSAMGISCVWYFLFHTSRFDHYAWKPYTAAAITMGILFLAPLFPVIFEKSRKLPRYLFLLLVLIWEISMTTAVTDLWNSKYFQRLSSVEEVLVCLLCMAILFVLAGSAVVFDRKMCSKESR